MPGISPRLPPHHLALKADAWPDGVSRTLPQLYGILLSGWCIAMLLLNVRVLAQPDVDSGDAADVW